MLYFCYFFHQRLVTTGTIEERIYLRQIKKQDLSGSVMDLIINNPTSFSPEELKALPKD